LALATLFLKKPKKLSPPKLSPCNNTTYEGEKLSRGKQKRALTTKMNAPKDHSKLSECSGMIQFA
jgi:hypothetical protein